MRYKHSFMKYFNKLIFAALSAIATFQTQAEVKMPAIFSDHMVLQRDIIVPIWGTAMPGEKVSVSIAGHTKVTQADINGN